MAEQSITGNPGSYPAAFTLDKGRIGQVEYGNRVKTVSVGRLATPKRDEQHGVQCYQRWRIRAFLNPRHGRVRRRVRRMSHRLAIQREFGYISGYSNGGLAVNNSAQKRAIENYRSRLTKRGIVRFEIQALESDRDLIRALARKLTEEGQKAGQLRRAVQQAVAGGSPNTGGILAALRRSPLVGADLDLSRPREAGRKVDL
jgi:hypothetical protein